MLLALHRNGSAHQLHQVIYDGKPQAAADIIPPISRIFLLKGLEDPLDVYKRQA